MSKFSEAWVGLWRRVPPVLVILAVVAGGIWAFVELADEEQAGTLHTFDERVLLAFREPDDRTELRGPEWVESMVRDITALGGVVVLAMVTIAVTGYLLLTGRSHTALFMVAAVVSGALLTTWLKGAFGRPRPDLVPGIAPVFSASFPSGHAMMSTVTYMTLAALVARTEDRRRVRAYALGLATLLSLLIGLSRVYLAVHWPSDVLAGWAAGAIWALLGWTGMRWLQRRGKAEAPGDDEVEGDGVSDAG